MASFSFGRPSKEDSIPVRVQHDTSEVVLSIMSSTPTPTPTTTTTEAAVGFTLLSLSLVCLGTWPALLRLCSTPHVPVPAWLEPLLGYSSSLRSQPRDTRFAYLDYALSYVISSSLPLLVGLLLAGKNDDSDHSNNNSNNPPTTPSSQIFFIAYALVGGSLLSLGNLSMQWATTTWGAPLTTVLAIQASLTVTVGTSINYFLQPALTAHPEALAAGVVVFVVAIGLATKAHLLYGQEQQQQQHVAATTSRLSSSLASTKGLELIEGMPSPEHSYGSLESDDSLESSTKKSLGGWETGGMVDDDGLLWVEARMPHSPAAAASQQPRIALIVTILGGVCFGFFSPAMNVAVNDPFHWSTAAASANNNNHQRSSEPLPLSVAVANLYFSLAFCVASFVGNLFLMYRPPHQTAGLDKTTVWQYLACPLPERRLALLAGLVCGWANLLQFQGGHLVGFATADFVQAFPLVSTLWDMGLFGEFRHLRAGSMVVVYLVAMYILYLCGIGLLITSASASG